MSGFTSDVVTAPGVYKGISDIEYHSDRSTLSSSGARRLLAPSTPAEFKWGQDHPQAPKTEYDVGHAAHTLILGEGADIVRIDADKWTTNAVKEQVAAVRADGKLPLKPSDYDDVHAMAEAIKSHPIAAALFADGEPELSMYHQDPETGVSMRTRPDWLTETNGRACIVDYKTSTSAAPEHFSKSVDDYGYHVQDAWYSDAARALGISDNPDFLFVVQSKTAPYLVNVFELDEEAKQIGRDLVRSGVRAYADCTRTGRWPAHPIDIHRISLPRWAASKHQMEGSTL
ncbi:hypothetical protein CH302_00945 [Rhodococcus sp. 15-2388-1-1a]|uniref:PD-(D/E)XK nuclease-like domain-containing protein n=1 Tax=Nocardiaceae TaxID=85025 RepID=UPI00056C2B21|nr:MULTISPECIES: PD-(D/E)XK nuclease-like domain-containing protein [Rhodococcus]OZF05222.1 hypothetical protein CH302_00945 [Rhodococcus sp. 15-2388-1-1a]